MHQHKEKKNESGQQKSEKIFPQELVDEVLLGREDVNVIAGPTFDLQISNAGIKEEGAAIVVVS